MVVVVVVGGGAVVVVVGAVVVVEGEPDNIKITRPVDLLVARELLGASDG